MTIQYQISLEVYKEAWQPFLKKRGNSRWRLLIIATVLLFCCAYFASQAASFFNGVISGISGFAAFLFVFVLALQSRNIETFWKANPFLAKPLSLTTSLQNITLQSHDSRTELTWHAFARWNETPNLFLLHLSEQTFYVVPKRAFADATQMDEFRSLLKTLTPRKRQNNHRFPLHNF